MHVCQDLADTDTSFVRDVRGEMQAADGNHDLMGELHAAHFDEVLAFCVRRVGFAEGQDAAADVFAVAWRRLDSVAPSNPRAWLFGIARNVLRNLRRSGGRSNRLLRRVDGLAQVSRPGPDDVVIRKAEHDHLLTVVDSLQPDDREILLLAAWEELTAEELGVALGITASAAAQRLHRAKRRLAGSDGAHRMGRSTGGGDMNPADFFFEELKAANPLPDPSVLRDQIERRYLDPAGIRERAEDMPNETQTPVIPLRQRPWTGIAAGVAIVAALATAIALVARRPAPVSQPEPTPVEIATMFIETIDPATADLLAPDAEVNFLHVARDTYAAYFEWLQAIGATDTVVECVEQEREAGADAVQVRCDWEHQNAWAQTRGLGPYGGRTNLYTIEGGQITAIDMESFDTSRYSAEVWTFWNVYVGQRSLDDARVMFTVANGFDNPDLSPESIELWREYTEQYLAENRGG